MAEWTVHMQITGRFIVTVEADSEEAANDAAIDIYSDADFGELSNVDAQIVRTEKEGGNS